VISDAVEHPLAFSVIAAVLVAWLLAGAFTGFPDFWSALFQTATGVVTFLLLFIIQHNQGRFNLALHIKLNELIRNTKGAHNALLDLEKLTDYDLTQVWAGYAEAGKRAREDLRCGRVEAATASVDIASVLLLIERGALKSSERIAALDELAVLDTAPEPAFERLTRAACIFAHVPVALVSLVDARRQFFKSSQGLPAPWSERTVYAEVCGREPVFRLGRRPTSAHALAPHHHPRDARQGLHRCATRHPERAARDVCWHGAPGREWNT
jgi:low affinity Fe/Cu permease